MLEGKGCETFLAIKGEIPICSGMQRLGICLAILIWTLSFIGKHSLKIVDEFMKDQVMITAIIMVMVMVTLIWQWLQQR